MTRNRDVSAVQNNLGVAIPPAAAGKNAVINGGFDIWQRGTSIASGAATPYTADRWQIGRSGSVSGVTVSRQSTNDTTNLPFIQYCARVQRDSGNTSTAQIYFMQSFETANAILFAGKTITISLFARSGANFSQASSQLNVRIDTGTGTDQNVFTGYSGSATVMNQNATLTTTWQKFSYSVTLANTVTELGILLNYIPVGTAGVNDYFEVTGVQLELGSSATPFSRNGSSIQGELAACQRYYYRALNDADNRSLNGLGWADSATTVVIQTTFPVPMRIRPTGVETTGTASNYLLAGAGLAANATAVTFDGVTTDQVGCTVFTISGGGTAGRVVQLRSSGANRYIAWSAEL